MGTTMAGWMRGAAAGRVVASLVVLAVATSPSRAQPAPAPAASRVALVIGEGAYRSGPLPAAPDDAGLVAQVLAGAGFAVTGARDLDGDALRGAFRDFLDRAAAAGPDGIAVVYVAGRAIQSDGENFVVPVDARLARPADVPIEALRLADFTHALAALPIQARVVIVDGAYAAGPVAAGSAAPGLALMEAEPGELIAFNAAPGTAAPPTSGPYGVYAQALVAAAKQGGVPIGEVFARVRLAVDRASGGAEVPWQSDRLTRTFTMFDRASGAPAVASAQVPFAALERRPLRDFPPEQAYDVALARDTLPAYVEFLTAYPADPLARRVRLILAVRREALFWRAAGQANAPGAYWTYLVRYPKGPHAGDARRRLTRLAAAASPPPSFAPLPFDIPPPGPADVVYDRVLVFTGPDLPPPPPPPVFLLPPPVEVIVERPPSSFGPAFLPVPVPVAIPFVRSPVEPGAIVPPRGVAGDYPHPRPYARGPNGDGLVAQAAPRPPEVRPPAPAPALPAPSPAPQTVPSSPSRPEARPQAQHQAQPQPRPPAAAPTPTVVVPPPVQPVAPVAGPPKAPAAPVLHPGPVVAQPSVPQAPVAPTPPAGRAASSPPGPTSSPPPETAPHRPAPRDRPAPAGNAPAVPAPPGLSAPAPAAAAPPAATVPAAKPPASAPAHRPPAPAPAASVAPAPVRPSAPPPAKPPAPTPPAAAERPAPAVPQPAAAERPPATPQPVHPTAPAHPEADRPAPGAATPHLATPHPPGEHRAACGHPGEPACHP